MRRDERGIFRRVLVTDRARTPGPDPCEQWLQASQSGRCTAILLRERNAPAESVMAWVRRLSVGLAPVLVAHTPAVARQTGAYGVHLGWTSPTPHETRAVVGPHVRIGASVHSVGEGIRRAAEGADYLMLGPILETPKAYGPVDPLGFSALGELASAVGVPVIGVGGLCLATEALVLQCGAAGWAAIRAFLPDPEIPT